MYNDLYESRIEICKKCPLYKLDSKRGPVCNNALYINISDKKTTSILPKKGYIKGCGCHLKWKIANRKSKCPAGKWSEC